MESIDEKKEAEARKILLEITPTLSTRKVKEILKRALGVLKGTHNNK